MKTAQQIRKEIVEQKYPDILSKIEEAIEKDKSSYCVDVPQNVHLDINASEIVQYMRDLGYECEFEWVNNVGFCFQISW